MLICLICCLAARESSHQFHFYSTALEVASGLELGHDLQENLIIGGSDSMQRQWHPTPVPLPGKSMDGGAW